MRSPLGDGPGVRGDRGEAPRVPDPRAGLLAVVERGVHWRVGRVPSDLRPAAVLVLFGPMAAPASRASTRVPADLDVLLVARSTGLSQHAGQVAFPGGRADPEDADAVATALREAQEETGLDPAGVEVLGTIGELPVPVSRHRVTPVVAWWREQSAVRAVDLAESARVFRAPVADLVDPERRARVDVAVAGRPLPTPAFLLDGHVVWGFTAVVLDRLLDELGWAEPWDLQRVVPVPR